MQRAVSRLWTGIALLGCLSLPWLAHLAISGDRGDPLRWALVAVPTVALAGWAFTRAARRPWWLLALVVAGAVVYLLERRVNLGLAAAYGLPHAGAYLVLLWWFGRTLRDGSEPFVTRLARRVHGALSPGIEGYTRRVTVAWCVFFAAQIAISLALFALAPLETWSLFVNVLNAPLLALMFAGEYLVRITRHPDRPRASLSGVIRAFSEDVSISAGARAP